MRRGYCLLTLTCLVSLACGRSNLWLEPPDENTGGVLGRGGASARGGGNGKGGSAFGVGGRLSANGGAASGGAGSGGRGSGGTASAGAAGKSACGELIDDMESGSGRICKGEGRVGVWYAFNDDSAPQDPVKTPPGVPIPMSKLPAPRGASLLGVHTSGKGFTDWGGGIGFDLNFDGQNYRLYDAHRYGGVRFWLRGEPDTDLQFRVSSQASTATQWGGTCSSLCAGPAGVVLPLGPRWVEYVVPFDEVLGGFGYPGELDKLTNVQFKVKAAFDFWVDDVSFFSGEANCCAPSPSCAAGARFSLPALRRHVLAGDANSLTVSCSDACRVRAVSAQQESIAALDGLECLSALNQLTLNESGLRDLSALTNLPALTQLSLASNEFTDISALASHENLSRLDLSDNFVRDIGPLAGLTSLRRLVLDRNPISNIDALRDLLGLSYLSLAEAPVTDVTPLAGLARLKHLDLSRSRVVEVTALSGLASLTELDLSDSRVVDPAPLAALDQLQTLNLARNLVTNMAGLSGMPALVSLDLTQNQLAALGSLRDLPLLTNLTLNGNSIADITPLGALPKLGNLNLDDNLVEELDPLRGNSALLSLSAKNNRVATLTSQSLPPSLTYVDLTHNELTQIALEGTKFLRLVLKDNLLSDASGLPSSFANIPCGPRCGDQPGSLDLSNNQLTDLSGLLTPTYAQNFHVNVRGNPFDCQTEAATLRELRARGVVLETDCDQ